MPPPTLAYPPRLTEDGQFVMVEQGSQADLEGICESILRTPLGHWDSQPEMGLPELQGIPGGPDPDAIREMVEQIDPRLHLLTDEQFTAALATVDVKVNPRG